MNDKELKVAEKIRKMNDREIAGVLDELRCWICHRTLVAVLTPIVRCYSEQEDYCLALGINFDNQTEKDRERIWAYAYVAHVRNVRISEHIRIL